MKRRSIYKISMGLLLGIILSTFIYGLAVNAEIENTSSSDGEEKSVPKAAADEYSNIFISKLQRTYKVDNYGLTRIKNKMILHNDRPTSLVSMKVCLSDEETDSLVFYGAFNRDNLPISMSLGSEKLNGYNVFDIVFDTPIHPYSNKTINVKYTLKEAFEYEPETSEFDIDVRVNPLTPYKIVSSNTQ